MSEDLEEIRKEYDIFSKKEDNCSKEDKQYYRMRKNDCLARIDKAISINQVRKQTLKDVLDLIDKYEKNWRKHFGQDYELWNDLKKEIKKLEKGEA